MAKARSRIVDYLVYLAIRIVIALVQALPFSTACRLAEWLAGLAYRIDRRHRLVADEPAQKLRRLGGGGRQLAAHGVAGQSQRAQQAKRRQCPAAAV